MKKKSNSSSNLFMPSSKWTSTGTTTVKAGRRGSFTMSSIRKSREGTKEEQQPLLTSQSLASVWESAAKNS
jgi:hypothetical protein